MWLERKILPDSLLRSYIEDIGASNEDASTGFFSKRPSRSERAVDDPIREMEGMLVDEYGRCEIFNSPICRAILLGLFFCICFNCKIWSINFTNIFSDALSLIDITIVLVCKLTLFELEETQIFHICLENFNLNIRLSLAVMVMRLTRMIFQFYAIIFMLPNVTVKEVCMI